MYPLERAICTASSLDLDWAIGVIGSIASRLTVPWGCGWEVVVNLSCSKVVVIDVVLNSTLKLLLHAAVLYAIRWTKLSIFQRIVHFSKSIYWLSGVVAVLRLEWVLLRVCPGIDFLKEAGAQIRSGLHKLHRIWRGLLGILVSLLMPVQLREYSAHLQVKLALVANFVQ